MKHQLSTVISDAEFDLLESLERQVTEWGKLLDDTYSGDNKWQVLRPDLDPYVFCEWDVNSLYPTSLVSCPLPIGNAPPRGTTNETEMLMWLEEGPHPAAPEIPGIGKFPVSHYGIYMVDLNPPANRDCLTTSIIPKQDKEVDEDGYVKSLDETIDWHSFQPLEKHYIDSYTLWTAIHLQGWRWVKGYKAFRYACTFEMDPTFRSLYDERLRF